MPGPAVDRGAVWVLAVLAVTLTLGIARMKWAARTGSEEFAASVHSLGEATLGAIWDWRTPAQRQPDEQLEFWTAEIDRILAEHPEDAELHAAAAAILEEPCSLFMSELWQQVFAGCLPWLESRGTLLLVDPLPIRGDVATRRLAAGDTVDRALLEHVLFRPGPGRHRFQSSAALGGNCRYVQLDHGTDGCDWDSHSVAAPVWYSQSVRPQRSRSSGTAGGFSVAARLVGHRFAH